MTLVEKLWLLHTFIQQNRGMDSQQAQILSRLKSFIWKQGEFWKMIWKTRKKQSILVWYFYRKHELTGQVIKIPFFMNFKKLDCSEQLWMANSNISSTFNISSTLLFLSMGYSNSLWKLVVSFWTPWLWLDKENLI